MAAGFIPLPELFVGMDSALTPRGCSGASRFPGAARSWFPSRRRVEVAEGRSLVTSRGGARFDRPEAIRRTSKHGLQPVAIPLEGSAVPRRF